MRFFLFLFLLIPSLSWGNCYDDFDFEWYISTENIDFHFTNNSNKEIEITRITLNDSNSNIIFNYGTSTIIKGEKYAKKNLTIKNTSSTKNAKTASVYCEYASTKSNLQDKDNSIKNNRSKGYDNGQIIFLFLVLAFVGFIILVSKSKNKHSNLKPKSEELNKTNKSNIETKQNQIQTEAVNDINLKKQEEAKTKPQIDNEKIEINKNQKLPFHFKLGVITVVSPIILNAGFVMSGGRGLSSLTFPILIGGLAWTMIAYFISKGTKSGSQKIKNEIAKTIDKKPDINKDLKSVIKDKIQDNKDKKQKEILKEDEIYDEIGKEIENNKKIRSVWTKSLALADGDASKAEANYIKLRFEQIKNS